MKKLSRLYLFLVPVLLFLTSCNDELTYEGGVETPVIFGLIDKADSMHYIKVTHSFAGNNNAVNVALIPDSSYYKDIEVKVEEWVPVSSTNAITVLKRTWILRDTILTNKAPGAFYAPDQKVYYFKTAVYNNSTPPNDNDTDLSVALKATSTYKLIATVNGGEYTVTAETRLVDPVSITAPITLSPLSFATSTAAGVAYQNATVKTNIGTSTYSSQVVDASLIVHFKEFFNGVPVEKSFNWKLGEFNGDEILSSNVTFSANGSTFYNLIKSNVTNDPTITKRQLSKIEIVVTGGSEDLSKYILVTKPSSSLAQSKPTFTNLTCSDGRQAIGIFTSRNTVTQTKVDWNPGTPSARAIDTKSVRELCTGAITGSLLFCSDNPIDINNSESYTCQ